MKIALHLENACFLQWGDPKCCGDLAFLEDLMMTARSWLQKLTPSNSVQLNTIPCKQVTTPLKKPDGSYK